MTVRHLLPESRTEPAARAPVVLGLREVRHRYGVRTVLQSLNLDLERGSLLTVHGANGAGKSTLLRVIAGLLRPTEGRRECDTTALLLSAGDGGRRRERVGTALRTAAAMSGRRLSAAELTRALDLAGLDPELGRRRVGELSTGQQGRLTLAVALVVEVGVICLDEPSAHLDSTGPATIGRVLLDLLERGRAVVMATHDPELLTLPADARFTLRDGQVCAGPP